MEEAKTINSSCSPTIPLSLPLDCKIRHIPMKRGFDILFSLLCLFIGAPIFLLIAVAIFATSPGRIVYSHERIGRSGKPFRCYKFRTMHENAEELLQGLLESDLALKIEWEKNYKLKKDPRITRIGLFLRKTSLDELPQFWNVLKGNLSVVGPRAVVSEEMTKYYHVKAYKILSIRPGLTGYWQVYGRSDVPSYETRVKMDEYYVENQSFLLDLKLIAMTIPAMLFARGAY